MAIESGPQEPGIGDAYSSFKNAVDWSKNDVPLHLFQLEWSRREGMSSFFFQFIIVS